MDLKNPIIIGGCGSSGTTLLRKMLDTHPNIAIGPEMSVFDRPTMYEMNMNDFSTAWIHEDFEEMEKGCLFPVKFGDGRSYFAAHRDEYQVDADPILDFAEDPVQFWRLYFSKYAGQQGKRRWGEKSPNNIFEVERILEHLPDARFVYVLRDGRDAVYSLAVKRGFSPFAALCRWRMATEIVKGIMRDWFNAEEGEQIRVYGVQYERLVRQPEETLRDLCCFLGEDFDPKMIEENPVHADSIGQYQQTNATFARTVDLMIGDLLRDFGYV